MDGVPEYEKRVVRNMQIRAPIKSVCKPRASTERLPETGPVKISGANVTSFRFDKRESEVR